MGRGRKLEDLEVRACKDGECAKSTRMAVTGRIEHAALELGDSVNCHHCVSTYEGDKETSDHFRTLVTESPPDSIRLKQTQVLTRKIKNISGAFKSTKK